MDTVFDRSFDVIEFLSILHNPGDVYEIRIPKVGARCLTYGGFFQDHKRAASSIANFDKISKPSGIYVTLNPVSCGIKKRLNKKTNTEFEVSIKANHSIGFCNKGAQANDSDIAARRWLYIDVDPKRPTGTSSTEHQASLAIIKADAIQSYLESFGWPAPLRAMSGNGAYLLYRIDEPNNAESDLLVENCLYAISEQFSEDDTGVDISVHNAARICKVIGTWARKGTSTDDNPHRQSWFIRPKEALSVVPHELLNELALKRKQVRTAKQARKPIGPGSDSALFTSSLPVSDPIVAEAIRDAREKLSRIDYRLCDSYPDWRDLGAALHFIHDSMLADFIEFSRQSPKFDLDQCHKLWMDYDRSKGVTDRKLNYWLPDEFAITKHIQTRLATTLDIDDDTVRDMIYSDFERFNKSQRIPMKDGQFMSLFQRLHLRESQRRLSKGALVGSLAISQVATTDEKQEPVVSDLPPMPAEVVKAIESTEKSIDKIADRTELTADEKAAALRSISKRSKALCGVILPPMVEDLLESWQLYRTDETPPIYTLEYFDVDGEKHHRIELSAENLVSYVSTQTAAVRSGTPMLPTILAKHWLNVISSLRRRETVIEADRDRGIEAAIARSIVIVCLQATHNVAKIGMYAGTTLPTRDSVSFYEGDPSNPDCFWFDNDLMVSTVTESIRDSKVSRRQIGDLLRKCGINSEKTPSHWGAGRKRYRQATRSSFSLLCHLGGVQFQMRTYQSDRSMPAPQPYDDDSEFTGTDGLSGDASFEFGYGA